MLFNNFFLRRLKMTRIGDLYPVAAAVIIMFGCSSLLYVVSPGKEKTKPIESYLKTKVCARLNRADPERKIAANIEYYVSQGWREGSPVVKFFSTLEGELYETRFGRTTIMTPRFMALTQHPGQDGKRRSRKQDKRQKQGSKKEPKRSSKKERKKKRKKSGDPG
jgi:hypothetical protein